MVSFSCCLIVKDEEKTLPKLLQSLESFKQRGGEVCVADTGSTDRTVQIAKDWGCKVVECGNKFATTIDKELAKKFSMEGLDIKNFVSDILAMYKKRHGSLDSLKAVRLS